MSENKHTPGPWMWVDFPSGGLQIKAKLYTLPQPISNQPDSQGKVFSFFELPVLSNVSTQFNHRGELWATLAYESFAQFPTPEWTEMQTANARLIAAAPDMLEENKALLALLAQMVDFFSNQELPDNYGEYRTRHDELIGKAKAMIEKPKGEDG